LLVGGDGRYYNIEAIFIILKLACASGVSEVHIPRNGVMSTPACSAYIRQINAETGNCIGGILLTASHNPGGVDHDFGIKFNGKNGGPAPEEFTNAVHSHTQKIEEYTLTDYLFEENISLNNEAVYRFTNVNRPLKPIFIIRIVENIAPYVNLMKSLFDFPRLKKMFARKDFTFRFDAMHGVSAAYAKAIFQDELGCSP
jgi:phosphoglucomutase